mmetsp:Transcript_127418/g.302744  ORF Transcript_127418/g.302744 Transcript_127418/m.302744 type:complete len:204 (-) Transcript_127418:444-1055(-)
MVNQKCRIAPQHNAILCPKMQLSNQGQTKDCAASSWHQALETCVAKLIQALACLLIPSLSMGHKRRSVTQGSGAMRSTQRPLIFPFTMSSKMALMSSSFLSSTVHFTCPSPQIVRDSFRSLRVPTIEPRIVFRWTIREKISTMKSPGGREMPTAVPMGRSMSTPCRNAASTGARITVPCAPTPSQAAFTAATMSSELLPWIST